MNYILFDGPYRDQLLPFTYTRPVAEIRVGILSIREKWENYLKTTTTTHTAMYLAEKFPKVVAESNIMINASVLPTLTLVNAITQLNKNQALIYNNVLVAYCSDNGNPIGDISNFEAITFEGNLVVIKQIWDIFSNNGRAIASDFKLLTEGKTSMPIPSTVNTINPEHIFIEEGAKLNFATLNASTGPIYIGKDSEILEGALVRGAFALCNNATLKMGAKIYGPTTVGPYSKVGGEVNNSVIFGYSNKGHDGFLGNSVIGEWCNLGADTNNSNLKNNYAEVKLWNYPKKRFLKTGLQFCGLMMGDHSKSAINTMFNTGTVVGVSANIFGSGFPSNFVPSFTWGGSKGYINYKTKKAFEVAEVVMARRHVRFTETDKTILTHVYEISSEFRRT